MNEWSCLFLIHLKLKTAMVFTIFFLFIQNPTFCWCLNTQGLGSFRLRERIVSDELHGDHCSGFGVKCSDDKLVILSESGCKAYRRNLRVVAASTSSKTKTNTKRDKTPFSPSVNPADSPLLSTSPVDESSKSMNTIPILCGVVGGFLFIFALAFGIVFCQRHKLISAINPWATGVPKLKRSELETACEDFSNIIGTLLDRTIYKGTLPSGVEIAVMSFSVTSPEYWSKELENQYRHKIDTLSKVNHKNFLNLIGFCEEDVPFTRMMVFEYAPNGTLFEHLHIMEAERLDWGMRLRIAMGIAYSLDHMHHLIPPIPHTNLQSSSIYLTEDYAAKISDFSFSSDIAQSAMGRENNVYSFGLILFEMITCRFPYSETKGSLTDLSTFRVDPNLKSYQEEELIKLVEVIKDCVNPDPYQRPTMKETAIRLKQITRMRPDEAAPKSSPLWWAQLEILSVDD